MKSSRYSCLLSLSCAHRTLRRVCITAGIFRHMCPTSMNFKTLHTFREYLTLQQLVSLSIDLRNNSKVWSICAQVIEQFPDLDELQLLGSAAQGASLFNASHLSRRFSLFKGSSLVLGSACFTRDSLPIVRQINCETVTSLYFEKSKLHFSDPYSAPWLFRFPMFPNLKTVKFIGVPVTSDQYRVDTIEFFADLFVIGCQLTHFEISYGFGPFCSAQRISDPLRLQKMVNANVAFVSARQKILLALRRHSSASLKVFIDHDRLAETFIADNTIFHGQENVSPFLFRNMKLLVLKVDDITFMCQEYPPNDEDCDSTLALPSLRKQHRAQHHHSVWLHVCCPQIKLC
jgi:hypothetical protein